MQLKIGSYVLQYLLGTEEAEKSGTGGFPSFDLRDDLRGYLSFELIEFPVLDFELEPENYGKKLKRKVTIRVGEKELEIRMDDLPEAAELTLFSIDFSMDTLRKLLRFFFLSGVGK